MALNKYIFLVAGSFFVGLIGMIADFVYSVEEEGTLEGSESQYYKLLRPIWTSIVNPVKDGWYSIWRGDVMTGTEDALIAFSFWFIVGLMVVGAISIIRVKFRKAPK
jgi:hypothetical protein